MYNFLKDAFKQHDKVGVENISCLLLRLHKAKFARLDFSFASMQKIVDFRNIQGIITSHLEQPQRTGSLGSR